MTDKLSSLLIDLPPVRRARPSDAPGIAQVHVDAWRQTYAGLLSPARVARHSVEDRTRLWREVLSLGSAAPALFLAEPGGRIAGFLCMGRQRSGQLEAQGFDREVSAVYLVAEAQGRGLGRALMSMAAHHLLDTGGRGLALWALAANASACGFYAALGGQRVADRVDGDGAQLAFGWDDPTVLL